MLTSAAAGVAVVGAAVFFAPSDFRIPLAAGASVLAVLCCAAVTAAAYWRGEALRARRSAASHGTETEARIAATVHEANARISNAQAHFEALNAAVAAKTQEVKAGENRRAAALAAFAGAAGRMQAMSTSMLAELREMEHRHADPKVLADLLELDHRTAQAGRLADSIAVLSGARSGRRWAKPIAMESILRGAMGRVAGYQRVRLRAVTDIAIAGHAAEGVMHALAELLDNACNFSPPTTEVHVYAAEVPAGVVITIEDSGLVMSESALRRAEQTVSKQQGSADLSSLSGTRLGLAVVGHLARKHDLTVSYRPSAIGGTAVVVVVPRELTTRVERQTGTLATLSPVSSGEFAAVGTPEVAAAQPVPELVAAPAAAPEVHEPAPAGLDDLAQRAGAAAAGGLPRRRRGSTLAATHPGGLNDQVAAPVRPASPPSALGAFQRAVNGRGSSADPSPSQGMESE
ncbi:sensor histidine kinase [Nocardia sp. 2]|uniref:histidine kinase n=1 Tax=Nocardia acididurans TaxID=2802282 RepID=A0ABS1M2X3_9NOCA|nr:ATP-binding protein [Nocardia acididurans]MBL1074530.1 sensor histidine kinase [Nocardia acididurans]